MKFIFKLNNILDIKLKLEEQEKIHFSIAMEKLNSARERLRLMQIRKLEYENELRELLIEGASIQKIRQAEDGLEIIKMNVRTLQFEVMVEERNVEKARELLNEAIKERKIYEKLKENAFEQFKREVQEQEMKENDELVSYKFSPVTKAVREKE